MPGTASGYRNHLARRRHQIRRQHRVKIIQAIWRTVAISGLAGGLLWVALQPVWVVKAPEQIIIKSGEQLLSPEVIESLLEMSYPQSLWQIQPQAIANSLREKPTIAQAIVRRRLFPPGLNIEIQPRVPVAIAIHPVPPGTSETPSQETPAGLLDADGVLIPLEAYKLFHTHTKLPTLKVIASPEQYRSHWSQVYPLLSQSTVKITQVDWQDPNNLILKTELGDVHIGASNAELTGKIKILAQMRYLSAKMDLSQIKYIDLRNPASPLVRMNQTNPQDNPQNP
ncbi:cell division protein FtsQ/DivIB [Anabaenopsis elenkinii]|uniref:FtsQ-type POTRA domain-containing protein n=1 Tax=Anabaenopsis elenkinii CCIBt3563 TaxID=2779889 RepID=A0A7S6U725_9CYAN|nr:FtsQ-type POTRA domain-containing protein [Anabaenopsis elenkinii]QOV24388.1 FtsQ-type POTRA domain-containing protein [Anabaenopsis elenkinii CCIBt3563]